jgi:hypothetical protein
MGRVDKMVQEFNGYSVYDWIDARNMVDTLYRDYPKGAPVGEGKIFSHYDVMRYSGADIGQPVTWGIVPRWRYKDQDQVAAPRGGGFIWFVRNKPEDWTWD